jgi:hypothetical protein
MFDYRDEMERPEMLECAVVNERNGAEGAEAAGVAGMCQTCGAKSAGMCRSKWAE